MSAAAEMVLPMTDDGEVRTRTITDYNEFASLDREWDALVEQSGLDYPFVYHAWLSAWWRAFGAGRPMHVITVRKGGTLIGAAPLMVTEQRIVGFKARALESIANDHTPRFDLIVARDHANLAYAAIWQQLTDGRAAWDLLQLRQLPVQSLTLQRLKESAKRYGLPIGTWGAERSPYVEFRDTWDEYFAGLGYNHKRNVGKGLRRLQREGDVELEVVSSPEALDDALADGMRIEALAWKEDAGTAMLSRVDVQRFYETFALEAAERGLLRLFFLVYNGKRIAFSYGLLYKDTVFVLKGGYDPEFARYSPYNVLYSLVFQHCFDVGFKGYDFLGHDEPFKMKWTETVREHCWLYVFSRSPRGRLLHYLKFTAIPLIRNWLR
jgi:CelD/BcsL family acetyltransferase involved in cellulose biosynthesis